MNPAELVGLWSSEPYEYGSMEMTELALLPDGRGWSLFENSVGAYEIERLTWSVPEPGRLELHTHLYVSADISENQVEVEQESPLDKRQNVAYTLSDDTTPLEPDGFVALNLSERVVVRSRFGLRRREVTIHDDQTHAVVPYG
ncbi:hypothetical protein ACFQ05_21960 [Amycolatopsis umgeniensis]|uniref:THAP4-like heme-binding beta-barrel domain-containing protein n=1 Tax=Amycolatopsis umgeniensis TaxID=336628 RepID=A0A841BHD0_9PSEU|nr:hypothetical protein [Amycolatopsis umgeniensis]MBB5858288.1 hypothetical protein [Amycolatopsis umgeniensis]